MRYIPSDILDYVAHYIGTDSDNDQEQRILTSQIRAAYADLQEKTGVDWMTCETDNYDIALDVVCSKVYLSYYGNRDDAKNTDHLTRYIRTKTFDLKYSSEAIAAREA